MEGNMIGLNFVFEKDEWLTSQSDRRRFDDLKGLKLSIEKLLLTISSDNCDCDTSG